MKAKTIFIVVSNLSRSIDYPQNAPLPRVGETVITEDPKLSGNVTEIRHVLSGSVLTVNILVLP